MAINTCFTNGTPISNVVSVLGTNYTVTVGSESEEWHPPMLPPTYADSLKVRYVMTLYYRFGKEYVFLDSTAPQGADPLPYGFVRAKHTELDPETGLQVIIDPGGQLGGAANAAPPHR